MLAVYLLRAVQLCTRPVSQTLHVYHCYVYLEIENFIILTVLDCSLIYILFIREELLKYLTQRLNKHKDRKPKSIMD